MKAIRLLFTLIFAIFYIPINKLYVITQKWYFGMKKKDKIIFYLFTPFYWILVVITFAISAPYEFFIAKDLH